MTSPNTRAYNCWTPEEEDQLRAGVAKHGLGSWEIIRRDPEFESLEKRSGVQLKDKWRNLVKFRHISAEVSRTLKPKTSGPWSKKHSASAWARERSTNNTPSVSQRSNRNDQPDDEEHAATLLALESGKAEGQEAGNGPVLIKEEDGTMEPKRSSRRPHAKSRALEDYETLSELDDKPDQTAEASGSKGPAVDDLMEQRAGTAAGSEGAGVTHGGQRKKKRRLGEDRRYGIYDQRRYGPGGVLLGVGSRSRSRSKRATDDDETDEEMEDMEELKDDEDKPAPRRRGPNRAKRHSSGASAGAAGAAAGSTGEEEEYVVNCLCGVTHDDGAMMIECEGCNAWAHLSCLRRQMETDAFRCTYDFEHYKCETCQLAGDAVNGRQGAAGRRGMPAGSAVTVEDVGARGRPRRQRKASSRYRDVFAPLDELDEDLDGEKGEDAPSASGASQHSSKSSRDKTNEASTLLLLAKGGSGEGQPVNGWHSSGALGEARGRGGGRGGRGGRQRGQPARGADDDAPSHDQLELFLSSGRSSSRCGMPMSARDLLRNYPGRTSSPATAALAAAAAIAMKQHEAEAMQRSSSTDIPLMGQDPLAWPPVNTSMVDSLPAPKPLQHPALMRRASQKSLLSMGGHVAADDSNQGAVPPIPQHPSRPASISGGLSHHHHQQLLASLGLDGRQSPMDMLSALAGRRASPALGGFSNHGRPAGTQSPLKKPTAVPHPGLGISSLGSSGQLLHNVFGDSDDEHSHGLIDAFRCDPLLLNFLGSRASTPASHLFIDSLLRATPDILNASAHLGSPTAAAATQLQVLGAALQGSNWTQGPATAIGAGPTPRAGSAAEAGPGSIAGPSAAAAGAAHSDPKAAAPPAGPAGDLQRPATAALPVSGQLGGDLFQGSLHPTTMLPAAQPLPSVGPGSGPGATAAVAAAPASQQQQQQQLLREQAQRELAQLASLHGSVDLLRDLLRPGTPDTWGLLRGTTPTPADALSLMNLSGGLADPMAAASWLLQRATPPVPDALTLPAAAPLQPAPAMQQDPPVSVAAAAAAAQELQDAIQPAGLAVGPVAVDVPKSHVQPSESSTAAIIRPCVTTGGQLTQQLPVPGPAAAAAAAAGTQAASASSAPVSLSVMPPASLSAPEQVQLLQQAALHARKLSEDFADASFNIEMLLRASTPVPQ